MEVHEAVVSGFRNYANCKGRASRSEYWYWQLFTFFVDMVTMVLDHVLLHVLYDKEPFYAFPINTVVSLLLFVPSIAVTVRRLHDVNRSGRWFYIGFTIIGLIYPLLIWNCKKGTKGPNRFGPDPLK